MTKVLKGGESKTAKEAIQKLRWIIEAKERRNLMVFKRGKPRARFTCHNIITKSDFG